MLVPKWQTVKEGAKNYVKKNFTIYALFQVSLEGRYFNNCEPDGICDTHAGE
jgi:hypothetical protein